MANRPELSLLHAITAALTATECGPQSAGIDFDDKEYRIIGEVPIAVRNLHNLGMAYVNEQRKLLREAGDNEVALAALRPQLQVLKNSYEAVDGLRWALLDEAFPVRGEDVTGLAIMKDWQVAHRLRQEDDVPPELRQVMEMLSGGEVHIMIAGIGGRRTTH